MSSKLSELAELLKAEKRSRPPEPKFEDVLPEPIPAMEPVTEPDMLVEVVQVPVAPAPVQIESKSGANFALNQLQKEMQLLRKMVEKNHSMQYIGSGGGAGDVTQLDHPTRVVTGDYTLGRFDYYVGVNHTTATNITLPMVGIDDGRNFVIKDESGKASLIPIHLIGTIDNDPNGATLRINNGSLQLIYRNGWRVI